ncbi:hypothetical protein JXD20_01110 [Candidatus Peregrinibacteria bacterium]|nr:hypothetical protein [Candidatus Peregrinibacteria bacterium]
MKSNLNPNRPKTDIIGFTSMQSPEAIFLDSYAILVSMGVRHDIAQSLASYTAFQETAFDPQSSILVHLHEEIGQEPSVNGGMAA